MTGDRFKEIRDDIGASQRQLAEALQVGKGTIHRMEKKDGQIKRVYALAMKHLQAHPDLLNG
jgi:DNA-binding XRE family transcriptional regulator